MQLYQCHQISFLAGWGGHPPHPRFDLVISALCRSIRTRRSDSAVRVSISARRQLAFSLTSSTDPRIPSDGQSRRSHYRISRSSIVLWCSPAKYSIAGWKVITWFESSVFVGWHVSFFFPTATSSWDFRSFPKRLHHPPLHLLDVHLPPIPRPPRRAINVADLYSPYLTPAPNFPHKDRDILGRINSVFLTPCLITEHAILLRPIPVLATAGPPRGIGWESMSKVDPVIMPHVPEDQVEFCRR